MIDLFIIFKENSTKNMTINKKIKKCTYILHLNIDGRINLLTNSSKTRRDTNSVEVVIKKYIHSRNNRFLLVLHVLREYYKRNRTKPSLTKNAEWVSERRSH